MGTEVIPLRLGRDREESDGDGRDALVVRLSVALVALGLARLGVRYALGFPLWGDEAFLAINFLVRDFSGLRTQLEYGQVAPPGFLWAEWGIVRLLGVSEWGLRLLPFAAGMTSLVLFWRFCGRVSGGREALLAVALFATSFYPMRHAAEVKPYATDLLISLALTFSAWSVWTEPRSRGRWAGLLGLAGAAVWCSYTAVFPAAAAGLLVTLSAGRERSQRALGLAASYWLVLLGSWALMMTAFAGPQSRERSWLMNLTTWRDAFPPLDQPWRLPGWFLRVHTGNALAYPYGGQDFGSLATFVLVVRGAVALWLSRERRPLLLLLLGPIPFALAAAALHRYPYGTSARTMLYMAPAFCFLAGAGVAAGLRSRLSRTNFERGSVLIAALLGTIPLGGMIVDALMPYKSEDDQVNRRLIRELAARARPGDQWIVFNGASPPPRTADLMVQQWMQQVAEVRFYITRWAPVPVQWEPPPDQVRPVPGRTWLLVHQPGRRRFPYQRLARYQAALIEALGPPRSTRFGVGLREEFIEIHEFPGRPTEDDSRHRLTSVRDSQAR